jgi:C1A family cysteine protease
MKKQVGKSAALLSMIWVMIIFSCGNILAMETTASSAPLNPDFIAYINSINNQTVEGSSTEIYAMGHIPAPTETYLGELDEDSIEAAAAFPSSYDLRTTDRITAVKDQGQWGSCWTFASIASLESYLKASQTVDLSENNMMLNNGFDGDPNSGGNKEMATAYLARWSGPVSESADPYNSAKKTGLSSIYHVQDVDYLPDSASAIKQALMDGGALDTSICAWAMDYSEYYNETTNSLYYDGYYSTDHDVAIIGWDDNYSRYNFSNTPEGDGAWIIKNSWGSDWGDDGYFYLSYYDTYAGNNVAAFHDAEATDNYSGIYQYDTLGFTSARGYSDTSAWGANIFTATSSDDLTAISTYTLSPNASLEICIYSGVSSDDPESGQLLARQTQTIQYSGYHTIELAEPVTLVAGQKFSIVIGYTTPGYTYPIPVEEALYDYSSAASANPGESFIAYDSGVVWTDLSQSDINVCIKGFSGEESATAELQSIAITSPATKLSYEIGESLDLSGLVVTGTYSDGSSKVEAISAANISGFDSSQADASQVLTISVDGKTATYTISILAGGEITEGQMTGFLGQDPEGNYFLYEKDSFNASYLAYQINPSLASANMYKHYLNNNCSIVAIQDATKGYIDYNAAATASLMAQIKGQSFDINTYLGSSSAVLYSATVSNVGSVDSNGNVTY